MDCAFTSSDITTLGITDETTVNLLLKTTIKGSYSSPVPMYHIYSVPWFKRYYSFTIRKTGSNAEKG